MDITITMVQSEIIDAIKSYLDKHDILTSGKEIEISLTASRSPAGHSAVIAIKGNLNALSTAGMMAPVLTTPEVDPPSAPVTTPADASLFAADPVPEPVKQTRKPRTPAAPAPESTPAQVAQVADVVEDLFSEASTNAVEEAVAEVTEEEESLFGA
jgi:hypothetical protein